MKPLVASTSNGGQNWSLHSIVGTVTAELNGVHGFSATDAWVVGNDGTLAHYNGASWTKRSVPGWVSTKAFRAVSFADALHGWAVGDGLGVAQTVDGGDTWTCVTIPGTGAALRGVDAVDSSTAIAVGDSGTMRLISAGVASIKSSGTGNDLYGITFSDASHGWAVGNGATLVTSGNGGGTWSTRAVPVPAPYTAFDLNLRSVAFADSVSGVVVGTYQWAWRTTDGGATWRAERVPGGLQDYELRGVALAGASGNVPVAVGRGFGLQLSSDAYKARAYRGTWDRIDVTPPTTTSNAQGAYVGPATITLAATDAESGVAHTYWKLDNGIQHEGTTISVSTAGAHDIEFWSVDAAPVPNTETPHKTAHFMITIPDVTAPVTISDRVPAYVGPAIIHLTATDEVGGSGVGHTYFILDGAAQVEGLTVVASTAGMHTLEFWSVDVAGNPETPHKTATFEVTIPDTTPPTTYSDATDHYDSTAVISLTAMDNAGGSGVALTYWKLDGGVQTEGLSIGTSVVGAHTLEFWSVDVAGNPETPHKTASFSVAVMPPPDATKPATVSDAVTSYSGPATIHLTASDVGGSGVARTFWKLDGGVKTEGLTVVVPAAGAHDLEFWSEDVALNIETHHHALFSVVIPDAIAPVTDSNAKPSYLWTASITLTATDTGGSGVAHTYWKLDGKTTVEGRSIVTTAVGGHALEFWSVDGAGNPETPHKTAAFVVTSPPASADTTAPVTTWIDQVSRAVAKVTVTLSATDGDGTGVASIRYRLDGGSTTVYTAPLSVTKVGLRTLEFWSVDNAGNPETPKTATFTVAPPYATLYKPVAPSRVTHGVRFSVYGYVKPKHSSGYYLVTLNFYLRNSHGTYVYHSHVHAKRYYYSNTMTKYKATLSLPHRGTWRVRAYHSDAGHSPSYSGYDYITVR